MARIRPLKLPHVTAVCTRQCFGIVANPLEETRDLEFWINRLELKTSRCQMGKQHEQF